VSVVLTTSLATAVLANRGDGWWPLWLLFWLAIVVAVAWFLWRRWGRPRGSEPEDLKTPTKPG
jgi:hypothetical protein